jgi:hypothetical protein
MTPPFQEDAHGPTYSGPGVQFKPVEGDALSAYGDLGEMGPDLAIEAVSIHAEISRRVPQTEEAGQAGEGPDWAVVVDHDGPRLPMKFAASFLLAASIFRGQESPEISSRKIRLLAVERCR